MNDLVKKAKLEIIECALQEIVKTFYLHDNKLIIDKICDKIIMVAKIGIFMVEIGNFLFFDLKTYTETK